MAVTKGFLEHEKIKLHKKIKNKEDIEAQNYSIEDKRYELVVIIFSLSNLIRNSNILFFLINSLCIYLFMPLVSNIKNWPTFGTVTKFNIGHNF